MKQLIIAVCFIFSTTVSASAEQCPKDFSPAACESWRQAQSRPVYTGKVAETTVKVSCMEIRQKEPSAVALYEGNYASRAKARVITTFRNTGWTKTGRVYRKTICMPKAWLKKVNTFTICGSVGHYFFNSEETEYFRRQRGRLTSDDVARMWNGG